MPVCCECKLHVPQSFVATGSIAIVRVRRQVQRGRQERGVAFSSIVYDFSPSELNGG